LDLALLNILVVNAGSSSLKVRMLDGSDKVVASADLQTGDEGWDELQRRLDAWPDFEVSAHRVVHGGSRFRSAAVVDDGVVAELEKLTPLAPLHNPPAVDGIRTLQDLRPALPAVACFDTAFHNTLPPEVSVYGIPWEWTEELGVRRYGFHGLSHSYASGRVSELMSRKPEDLKVVTCHLGAGASLAAVHGGRSVDTTMGFTPLEGLIMATRSGSVDPGALLWLQQKLGLSPAEMTDTLEHSSGLLGMSGRSADTREILAAADAGNVRCRIAIDAYAARVRSGIAAMAASMGAMDALVFTGGVGETSPRMRDLSCQNLGFLGIELEPDKNDRVSGDADISTPGARTPAWVVMAREDLEIVREVRRVLNG
jgi:acetate kinase